MLPKCICVKLDERRFFTDSLSVFFDIFQDLTMHINVSGEQHTQSIKQLLKNISTKPESVKELGQWGLEIGTQIMMVRPLSIFRCSFSNILSIHFHSTVRIVFIPCRLEVELFPSKPSACNRHPLPPVLMCPGPERLSGTPPSVL